MDHENTKWLQQPLFHRFHMIYPMSCYLLVVPLGFTTSAGYVRVKTERRWNICSSAWMFLSVCEWGCPSCGFLFLVIDLLSSHRRQWLTAASEWNCSALRKMQSGLWCQESHGHVIQEDSWGKAMMRMEKMKRKQTTKIGEEKKTRQRERGQHPALGIW